MEAYPYKEIARGRVGRYEVELGELSTDTGPSPYSIIHMRPFACCVAFIEGRLAMVRQFRYSVSSWQLELPAGGIEDGEQPSAAAVRELREETGLVARELFDLGMVYCSVGSTDEECHLFAMSCERDLIATNPDRGEQTELITLTRAQVERMMDDGTLVFPPLYVAWVKLARMGMLDELFPRSSEGPAHFSGSHEDSSPYLGKHRAETSSDTGMVSMEGFAQNGRADASVTLPNIRPSSAYLDDWE